MMKPSGSVGGVRTQRRRVWLACTAMTSTSPTCRSVSRRVSMTVLKPTLWTVRPTSGGPMTTADLGSIFNAVSYTHLRAHETRHDLVCRLLLEKKKKKDQY